MTSPAPGSCRCGVDGVATCPRCGTRACATHYIISVLRGNGYWDFITPRGSAEVTRPISWTSAGWEAYVEGGPGCIDCRMRQAQAVEGAARALASEAVEAYCSQPSLETSKRLAAAPREMLTKDQVRRVLQTTYGLANPDRDLVSMKPQFEPVTNRRGTVVGRTRRWVVVRRRPVVCLEHPSRVCVVDDDGQLWEGRDNREVSASTTSSVVCSPGRTPTAIYSSTYGDYEGSLLLDRHCIEVSPIPISDSPVGLLPSGSSPEEELEY